MVRFFRERVFEERNAWPTSSGLIREFLNGKQKPTITSDLWHVVHAQWSPGPGSPRFLRTIVSEHDDSASALRSAIRLKSELALGMKARAPETRDQVMVKRPLGESLKSAGRLVRR